MWLVLALIVTSGSPQLAAHELKATTAQVVVREGHVEVRVYTNTTHLISALQNEHAWLMGDIDELMPENLTADALKSYIKKALSEKIELYINAQPIPFEGVEVSSNSGADFNAEAEHANLLAWEKQFLDALELPYRVIDVATGDLGSSAAKKFDIEAWIPTQGAYREVTSTSNTTEYQARRLKIRMRKDGHTAPLATLNGTLCAMPRIIVALLENHQQADGSVSIPTALQPYLGGRSVL